MDLRQTNAALRGGPRQRSTQAKHAFGMGSADRAEDGVPLSQYEKIRRGLRSTAAMMPQDCPSSDDLKQFGCFDLLICSPKTGPFRIRDFRGNFPWLGGAEDDEGPCHEN
jgi:hypothetical protein